MWLSFASERHPMLSPHQAKSLRKLRQRGLDWEPSTALRISRNTLDTLVTLVFLEEKRLGAPHDRLLRLTERGRRAADGVRY